MAKAAEAQAELPAEAADDELPSIIEFSEDVADAEAPDPLPVGEYPGEIRKVEQRESNAGNRYAAVSFYISPDEYPADYDPSNAPDGTTLVYRMIQLDDNARNRWRMRKFCEAIGATPSRQIDLNDWIGLTAKLAISHDTWEGEPRAQIDRVNPA